MATRDNQPEIKLHLLEPRATEKSYLEQTNRTYVFPVKANLSKQEIAKLVETEFHVTVTDVRTLVRKGKATRYSKGKHAYPGTAYRQDHKFAYVKLKSGDAIKVFGDQGETPANNTSAKEAEDPKAAKKSGQKASEADKNAGKESKA